MISSRVGAATTLLTVVLSSGCEAPRLERAALASVLGGEPIVFHDGRDHRLVVKLGDEEGTQVRGGEVDTLDPTTAHQLAEVAYAHGLTFAPLLRLDQATVDALEADGATDLGS